MHDSTLLIPDSGPEFLKSLRLATLYSETVHVFTFTKPETVEAGSQTFRFIMLTEDDILEMMEKEIPDFAAELEKEPGLRDALSTFYRKVRSKYGSLSYQDTPTNRFLCFTQEQSKILELLQDENILHSISQNALSLISADKDYADSLFGCFMNVLREALELGNSPEEIALFVTLIPKALPPSMPSLFEPLFEFVFEWGVLSGLVNEKAIEKAFEKEEVLAGAAVGAYLLLGSYYALNNNLAAVTWQREVQDCFDWCCRFLARGLPAANEMLFGRRGVEAGLGRAVLEETVPDVADLPFEEILEIRRRRTAELQAFRDGLRQLATEVDPELDAKALELALRDKVHKTVRPAVGDLKKAMKQLQLDAYKRLLSPTDALVASVIPAVISFGANAPLQTTALVGALGALVSKLYGFTVGKMIEQKRLTASNQWSILFRLEKRLRK